MTLRLSANEKGPYISVNRSTDPTQTKTLRDEYRRELQRPLRELKGKLREGIIERGSLDMAFNQPMPQFRFEHDPTAVAHFGDWLRGELNSGYLQTVTENNNRFVRTSYSKAVVMADTNLRSLGFDVDDSVESVLNRPVHQRKLQQLYTRNFRLLDGVTRDMERDLRQTLSQGLVAGKDPFAVARDINQRVDNVGMHRSTLIARTEIINAHTEATLERYKELGVEHVTIEAELITAGDHRVCPICAGFEGIVRTPSDWENSERPPFHPQCRCRVIPITPATRI